MGPFKRLGEVRTGPSLATDAQLEYIERLGGEPDPKMTIKEASEYIDELLADDPAPGDWGNDWDDDIPF